MAPNSGKRIFPYGHGQEQAEQQVTEFLEGRERNGHFFSAIDIAHFMPVEDFKARLDHLIRIIKKSPRAKGVARIYLPGQIEYETRCLLLAEGMPMRTELINEF